MVLADLLAPQDVLVDVRVWGKKRVLAELAVHAGRRLGLAPDAILDALVRREELGSTAMGEGMAIPHTRLPEVAAPFGVLARLRAPVPFDAVDDKPVDLVFLLALPNIGTGRQLNALACVARRLRDPAILTRLRQARGPDALREAFVAGRVSLTAP